MSPSERDSAPGVVMIGAFPPPVHGMSAVNEAVFQQLIAENVHVVRINVAARSLRRSLLARLSRMPRALLGAARALFLRRARGRSLYLSVSGGAGQAYEIIFVAVARLRRMRLYLHHHCFAYLDRPALLTRLLTGLAGPEATHITQSPGMADRLQAAYPAVRVAVPVSNVVFLVAQDSAEPAVRTMPRTLGFIGNIAAEKGIFDFLDLIEVCERENLGLRGVIAGPFQDAETEQSVRDRLGRSASVEYVGPKYGAEKDRFFKDIDVLVFPTRYRNETEGIVNHEAMRQNVPVIAFGRGCIPEIVDDKCGLVVDPDEPFVAAAAERLQAWLEQPAVFQSASEQAGRRFAQRLAVNKGRWDDLRRSLIGL